MAGRDTLLEYVMKVTAITPLPAPSSAYLRKALVLVKPQTDVETGSITECLTKSEVQALTTSQCWNLLDAGMNSIYVLPTNSLSVADILAEATAKFFTVIIDPAFTDISELDLGTFEGVKAWASADKEDAKDFSWTTNGTGFYEESANQGINLYWAFGKLLSRTSWKNQQYIEMKQPEGIVDVKQAELLFEDKVSFVLTSEEYGNRLALFANNRKAIVAPYIFEEMTLSLQGWALQYINLNQPDYNNKEASLLEDFLQRKVNEKYVDTGVVQSSSVKITLVNDNFMASGYIVIAEPKALWRIDATIQQGEI